MIARCRAADRCARSGIGNAFSRFTMKTQQEPVVSKHTPGPWRVVPTSTKGAGSKRRDVVSDGEVFSPAFVAGDVLEQDAQLIAAAPELLDALKCAVAHIETEFPDPAKRVRAWWVWLDLIAKAEGRTP